MENQRTFYLEAKEDRQTDVVLIQKERARSLPLPLDASPLVYQKKAGKKGMVYLRLASPMARLTASDLDRKVGERGRGGEVRILYLSFRFPLSPLSFNANGGQSGVARPP